MTDVVTLGAPHRGAPIAWGIGHGSRLLGLLPETSAFGRILDKRSEGVRDLVDGYVDELPPLKEARYRLVAATVTESARHPVGSIVGDYLVRPRSAVGRDRSGRRAVPGRRDPARRAHRPLRHPQPSRGAVRAAAMARLTSGCSATIRHVTEATADRELRAEATLEASPERVWELLTDLSQLPSGARSW